jgi:hypothetical protein
MRLWLSAWTRAVVFTPLRKCPRVSYPSSRLGRSLALPNLTRLRRAPLGIAGRRRVLRPGPRVWDAGRRTGRVGARNPSAHSSWKCSSARVARDKIFVKLLPGTSCARQAFYPYGCLWRIAIGLAQKITARRSDHAQVSQGADDSPRTPQRASSQAAHTCSNNPLAGVFLHRTSGLSVQERYA